MKNQTLLPLMLIAVLAVPARAGAEAGYETKARQASVGVDKAQYAILHALLGWKGGANPSFSYYKAKDLEVMRKAGISVRELSDPNERAALEVELGRIRHDYNNGVKNVYNKSTHISAAQMVQRHKALIEKYADRVTGWTAAPAGPAPAALAGYRAQNDRVTALIDPLNAMAQARTDADFDAALARFNAAAAAFGKGYQLSRAAGESYESVRKRGLAVYETERLAAITLGGSLQDPALDQSLEALKNKAGLIFEAGQNAGKLPAGQGSFESSTDPNAAASRLGSGLTADVKQGAPPRPEAKPGAESKPGFFGMLGTLFGGLLRTIGRVLHAVVKGLIGVGKALFS